MTAGISGQKRQTSRTAHDEGSAPFRAHGRVYQDMCETIGGTPMVRMSRLAKAHGADVELLAKLEFFNPASSVKDRIGLAMVEAMEASGALRTGGGSGPTVIEATSGNTGIALAMVCAVKGYRLILCMPESMSLERRKMLALLGAELELTPAAEGMKGALSRAQALADDIQNSAIPSQFDNPANPDIHYRTTAEEILTDVGGELDVFVAGVGTGGTVTGVGRVLRERLPNVKIVAVEPEDSAVLSGGRPGPHKIQGIGAGFTPANLDLTLIDDVITIGSENAFDTARRAARLEGCPCGISSGAALAAALEISERPELSGKRIVVILPSFAERYLSTSLFDVF
ncbi:MAG: cysteine synthase A [Rhodobacteraceae bacterium]|nr:cysteine synthase A [Paracoccaceae bacterium]